MNSRTATKREISDRYAKAVVLCADGKPGSVKGRVNCYICDKCKHVTKTTCIDNGTTPYLFACEKCAGLARSSFFTDIAPDREPTFEWFRPALNRVLAMRRKEPDLMEHILKGGLDYRRIAAKK